MNFEGLRKELTLKPPAKDVHEVDVIELYQIENNAPNPTKLTNEQITEKIWEWYTAPPYPQDKPEITQDTLIKKYLEIVEENPEPIPEPTIDDRLDSIFNN